MATGDCGYGMPIKKEVEDEPLQVNHWKNEFVAEKIKSEDEMIIVHCNIKSEQCAEVKEGSYCEECGGAFLSIDNFVNHDSLKSCCNCQYQKDYDMNGEDMIHDLKPHNFGSDCGMFSSKPPEETIVIKKEVTSENTSSTSCEKEFAVEIFSSGYYSNSFEENRIHEKNELFSKNLNERIDEECVENKTTEKYPVHHKVCSKSFIGSSDLNNHIDSNIRTAKKRFQCKFCSKSFNQSSHLKIHEMIHTGEKPFQCKICSKSFYQCSSLKNHERIHTGEKPFQCKICSKSFNDCSNLKNHERIHTGEKPFQCKICSKSFNQSSSLRMHEMIHTGVKPFQCKICSKSFIQKIYLKNHEKTHTGEKPFQCENCPKSFSQVSNLKKHKKIHTGEKPYQCEFCLKSFNQFGNMKIHEKIHTGKKTFQ